MPPRRHPQVFELNPAQKAAAHAAASPLLIVAGAGTGKTRTLTSRIVHLAEKGMPPERICAITFTNKAAKEMQSRVAIPGPFIGTFHSLGARILRKECHSLGRQPNFVIFDDHDSFDLVKKIVKESLTKDLTKERDKKLTPAFFAEKIAEIKNLDGPRWGIHDSSEKQALVAEIFQKYEAALARNNAFDFDDLIQKPVALFKEHPRVLEKYQALFDALLVDEYQDINPKQYELVKLLAGEHKHLSVVGDDEQTIYSWRYADIKTFLGFDKAWPGAQIHFLEKNYRSTANIINAAAAVAANNRYRAPKKLWTENPEGEPISLFEAWGEDDEAEWIAEATASARSFTPPKTVAVLYRTNAQSRALEQALIRREIPYQIFGGLKFYERREVKDAVAALRFAANDKDSLARERLEKNLSKKNFAKFRERAAGAGNLAPLTVLKIFLDAFGYFEYLEEHFINAGEREENVGELLNFASAFDDLNVLLERLSLLQATDDVREETDAKTKVTLSTIHMAKGLEFDRVFIAGASEGFLPHIRSIDNEEALEEERRLMYVAMTRAREKLHVSFYGMPSRFIGEIPSEYITLEGAHGSERADGNEEVVELD